jgi:hypothetical protein
MIQVGSITASIRINHSEFKDRLVCELLKNGIDPRQATESEIKHAIEGIKKNEP